MLNAPCKNCPDRYGGCWAKCEKYRAYRTTLDELAEKKRVFQARETDFFSAIHKTSPKVRR